jgi:hypothetical protein
MFTLQSKLIENAAASGLPKDFSQALANCNAPLKHRGPQYNTYVPFDGGFPGGGFVYAPGVNIGGPQFLDLKFINIDIPPWQNVPFFPQPFYDIPPWVPFDFDPQYYGGGDNYFTNYEPSITVAGHSRLGDVITHNLTSQNVNSLNIVNEQNIVNRQELINQGNVIHQGDTIHQGNTVHQGATIHQGDTTHQSRTYHEDTTHHSTVHNYGPVNNHSTVNNFYPVSNYAPVTFYDGSQHFGPTIFEGDTFLVNAGGVIFNAGDQIFLGGPVWAPDPNDPGGPPLGPMFGAELDVLTDVVWDGTDLKKKYRKITFIAKLDDEEEDTILTGVSCEAPAEEEE